MHDYEAMIRKEAQNQAAINRTLGAGLPAGNAPRQTSAIEEIAGRLGSLNESGAVLYQRIESALNRAAGPMPATGSDANGAPTPIESGLITIGRRLTELEGRMAGLFSLAERLELIA